MRKKTLLVLAAAAVVLVSAVAVLFVMVDADSFRGFIESRAEDALGRDVRLGKIGLSLAPVFGLQVDDVAVAARPGEGEGDLLALRSLRIGARLLPLLRKRLEVTSIVLVEPAINLARDAQGSWNFDLGAGGEATENQGPAEGRGAASGVTVDTIRITDGRFSLRDATRSPARPLEVALTDLDLEISGFGGDEVLVAVDGGRLEVADPALGPKPVQFGVGDVELAVRGDGRSIGLTRAELVVGKTRLAIAGTGEAQAEGWRVDIGLEPTSIDVAELSSLLGKAAGDLGVSLSGDRPVELEAGVHGVLAANSVPEVSAGAVLAGVTIGGAALARPLTDVSAVATLQGNALTIDGLGGRVGDSDVAGTLRLVVKDPPTLDFTLESRYADLDELLRLMEGGEGDGGEPATPPDPDSFVVRGVADGSLKVADGSWLSLRFQDLDARLRLVNGVATLEPVSMELYGGRFSGRLASDLRQVPQSFEFSGEAENVDVDPFIADQTGTSGVLMGRFTGRVAGRGAGTDPAGVIRSLEGEGVARIVDGRIGKLDVLRSVGQVAGVLGQRTLANLASESASGATAFSRLAGDFHIKDGALRLGSVLLESTAFDLTGKGTVNLLSSAMNGEFQIRFSPEVSAWMKEEGSRAAEFFWDSQSGRVVLPLGLSGPLDGAGARVDWGAAAQGVARRTIERRLTGALGNLLGGSRGEEQAPPATSPENAAATPAERAPTVVVARARRAQAPSGRFALEIVATRWGGSFLAQDFKIRCKVTGAGVERAVMTAVDGGGSVVQKKTVDLAARPAGEAETSFEVRVDGKRLLLAEYPVSVTVTAAATDGETAEVSLEIEKAGG